MTAPDTPASRPVDVPASREPATRDPASRGPAARDPAARAAMLAQLREYHRMEAEAEDAVDLAVVEDLHAVLTGRAAGDSAAGHRPGRNRAAVGRTEGDTARPPGR